MDDKNELHNNALKSLCRVCGYKLKKGGKATKQYLCSDNQQILKDEFGKNIHEDKPDIHPTTYCHPCRNVAYFKRKAREERKDYNPTRRVVHWEGHTDRVCIVCTEFTAVNTGGRPRKAANKPGRPPKLSPLAAINHIRSIAPPPLTTRDNVLITVTDSTMELMCPLCLDVVTSPVELLKCSTLVCAEFCCQWMRVSESLSCPCCYSDHMCYHDSIRPAPQIALMVLGSMQVTCKQCKQRVRLKNHKGHTESMCKLHILPQEPTSIKKCSKDQEVPHSHFLRKGYSLP